MLVNFWVIECVQKEKIIVCKLFDYYQFDLTSGLKGSFLLRKKFGRIRSELGERRMNPLSPVKFFSHT
jgi:hypothetical protein